MKTGMFLMLDRGIMDHWIYSKEPFDECHAWIDLLLLANIEDKKTSYKGGIIICKRGDVNYSISWLAKRWGWSRDKARRFLNILEIDGMVTVNATTNRTTITIEKYDDYNIPPTTGKATNRQRVRQRADSEPTQLNNDNNENNEYKNKAFYPNDEVLDEAFREYVNMRKKIKAPMTDRAITLAMKKLDELSMGDNDKAVKIVNQSVMNSWKGLFPLKDAPQKTGTVDWNKELEEVMKHARGRSTQTDSGNDGFIP